LDGPPFDWNAEAVSQTQKAEAADAEQQKKIDEARVHDTQPTLPLAEYAGTYSSEMYGDVNVSLEDQRLVLRLAPAPNFVADLEHWQYNTFRLRWRDTVHYDFPRGFVTFTIDGNGKTDELRIDQPNDDFWFYEMKLRRR
jgi:hypothetical protein